MMFVHVTCAGVNKVRDGVLRTVFRTGGHCGQHLNRLSNPPLLQKSFGEAAIMDDLDSWCYSGWKCIGH